MRSGRAPSTRSRTCHSIVVLARRAAPLNSAGSYPSDSVHSEMRKSKDTFSTQTSPNWMTRRGPRPLVVTTHGYGSQSNPALEARHVQQLDLFCFDVRGYRLSRPGCAVDPRGYVLTGLLDPSTSLLRGAVCDFVRAAQVAQHVQNLAGSPIAFCGRSFGGRWHSLHRR